MYSKNKEISAAKPDWNQLADIAQHVPENLYQSIGILLPSQTVSLKRLMIELYPTINRKTRNHVRDAFNTYNQKCGINHMIELTRKRLDNGVYEIDFLYFGNTCSSTGTSVDEAKLCAIITCIAGLFPILYLWANELGMSISKVMYEPDCSTHKQLVTEKPVIVIDPAVIQLQQQVENLKKREELLIKILNKQQLMFKNFVEELKMSEDMKAYLALKDAFKPGFNPYGNGQTEYKVTPELVDLCEKLIDHEVGLMSEERAINILFQLSGDLSNDDPPSSSNGKPDLEDIAIQIGAEFNRIQRKAKLKKRPIRFPFWFVVNDKTLDLGRTLNNLDDFFDRYDYAHHTSVPHSVFVLKMIAHGLMPYNGYHFRRTIEKPFGFDKLKDKVIWTKGEPRIRKLSDLLFRYLSHTSRNSTRALWLKHVISFSSKQKAHSQGKMSELIDSLKTIGTSMSSTLSSVAGIFSKMQDFFSSVRNTVLNALQYMQNICARYYWVILVITTALALIICFFTFRKDPLMLTLSMVCVISLATSVIAVDSLFLSRTWDSAISLMRFQLDYVSAIPTNDLTVDELKKVMELKIDQAETIKKSKLPESVAKSQGHDDEPADCSPANYTNAPEIKVNPKAVEKLFGGAAQMYTTFPLFFSLVDSFKSLFVTNATTISMTTVAKNVSLFNNLTRACTTIKDLLVWVLGNLSDFVDFVWECATGEPFFSKSKEIAKINKSAKALCESFETPLPNDRVHKDIAFRKMVIENYQELTFQHKAMSVYGNAVAIQVKTLVEKYAGLYRSALAAQKEAKVRTEPIWIYLSGVPGRGKTTLVNFLLAALHQVVVGKPFTINERFERKQETEFWEGYRSQWATTIDDVFQVSDIQKRTRQTMELIDMVNTNPYPVNMAFDKGDRNFESLVVVTTTNNKGLPQNLGVEEPSALYRRMTVKVEVRVKDQFIQNDVVQWCDESDIPGMINMWEFKIYVDDPTTNYCNFIGFNELIRQLALAYNKKIKTSDGLTKVTAFDWASYFAKDERMAEVLQQAALNHPIETEEKEDVQTPIFSEDDLDSEDEVVLTRSKKFKSKSENKELPVKKEVSVVDTVKSLLGNLGQEELTLISSDGSSEIKKTEKKSILDIFWEGDKKPAQSQGQVASLARFERVVPNVKNFKFVKFNSAFLTRANECSLTDSEFCLFWGWIEKTDEASIKAAYSTMPRAFVYLIHKTQWYKFRRSRFTEESQTELAKAINREIAEGASLRLLMLNILKSDHMATLNCIDLPIGIAKAMCLGTEEMSPTNPKAERKYFWEYLTFEGIMKYFDNDSDGFDEVEFSEFVKVVETKWTKRDRIALTGAWKINSLQDSLGVFRWKSYYRWKMFCDDLRVFITYTTEYNKMVGITAVAGILLTGITIILGILKFALGWLVRKESVWGISQSEDPGLKRERHRRGRKPFVHVPGAGKGKFKPKQGAKSQANDPQAESIAKKAAGSLIHADYRHFKTGDRVTQGYLFFLAGRVAVSTCHLMQDCCSITTEENGRVTEYLHDNFETIFDYNRDVAIVFLHTAIERPNLSKHLPSREKTADTYFNPVRMEREYDGSIFFHYGIKAKKYKYHLHTDKLDKPLTEVYEVRYLNNEAGDCVLPYFTYDTKVQEKLFGIHVAGRDGDCFVAPLYKEDVTAFSKRGGKYEFAHFGRHDRKADVQGLFPDIRFTSEPGSHEKFHAPKGTYKIGEIDTPMFIPGKTNFEATTLQKGIHVNGVHIVNPYPLLKKPVHLAMFKTDKGYISPLKKALSRYSTRKTYPLRAAYKNPNIFKGCEYPGMDEFEIRPLTMEEAVIGNGRDIDPISLATSPGLPFVDKGIKLSTLVKRDIEAKTVAIDPRLSGFVQEYITTTEQEFSYMPAWCNDILKDETRPIARVDNGDTRLFSNMNKAHMIYSKMYIGMLKDVLMNVSKHKLDSDFATGIDPNSAHWRAMYIKLMAGKNRKLTAMDTPSFDISFLTEFKWCMIEYFWKRCGLEGSKSELTVNQWNWKCHIAAVVCSTLNSVHFTGHVVYLVEGMPSGAWATTFFNTLLSSASFRAAWNVICERSGNTDKIDEYDTFVKSYFQGDDNISGIDSVNASFYNQLSIRQTLLELNGWDLSNPDKSAVTQKYIDMDEAVFLQRRYRVIGSHIFCPLEEKSITSMVHWVEKGDKLKSEQEIINYTQAIFEFGHYGEQRYEQERKTLNLFIRHLDPTKVVNITYREWLDLFVDNQNS